MFASSIHTGREAAKMIADGKTYAEVAAILGIGRSVVFRAVQEVNKQAATREAA